MIYLFKSRRLNLDRCCTVFYCFRNNFDQDNHCQQHHYTRRNNYPVLICDLF